MVQDQTQFGPTGLTLQGACQDRVLGASLPSTPRAMAQPKAGLVPGMGPAANAAVAAQQQAAWPGAMASWGQGQGTWGAWPQLGTGIAGMQAGGAMLGAMPMAGMGLGAPGSVDALQQPSVGHTYPSASTLGGSAISGMSNNSTDCVYGKRGTQAFDLTG